MAESTVGILKRPSLIGVVAAKEFMEIRRDGRFRWTAALMVLLLMTAFLTGWQRFADFDAIPRFTYIEEPMRAVAARLAPSLLGPLGLAVALMAVAFGTLRRYQVAAP